MTTKPPATDAGHPEDQVGELPQVMTVDQVSIYLQIGPRTIYQMTAAGAIPAVKGGAQWRFFRPESDRWVTRVSRQPVGEEAPATAADTVHR